MLFALGIVAGLVIAVLVFIVVLLFRKPLEHHIEIVGKQIELASPIRERGGIFMPKTDTDELRESIIEENAAQGKDTPISELL